MSDDELLKSLDTYACQLREANAKLIYAAKARIEALRGEVARLDRMLDGARGCLKETEAEAARQELVITRLKGALESICAIAYDHGSIAAIAHARKALAGETT